MAKRKKARETDDLYEVVGFTKRQRTLTNQWHLQKPNAPKPTGEVGGTVGHKTDGIVKLIGLA